VCCCAYLWLEAWWVTSNYVAPRTLVAGKVPGNTHNVMPLLYLFESGSFLEPVPTSTPLCGVKDVYINTVFAHMVYRFSLLRLLAFLALLLCFLDASAQLLNQNCVVYIDWVFAKWCTWFLCWIPGFLVFLIYGCFLCAILGVLTHFWKNFLLYSMVEVIACWVWSWSIPGFHCSILHF